MSSSISVGMMDTSQLPGMVKRIMRYCVKQSVCEAPLRQSTTCPVSKSVEPVNSPNMDSRPNDWRDETATSEQMAPCRYSSPCVREAIR